MLATERSRGADPTRVAGAESWPRRLAGAWVVPGGAALAALVVLTVADALSRHIVGSPIFGVDALSEMALAVVVASAIALGAVERSHVRVNLLQRIAGRRVTRATDAVALVVGVSCAGFTAFALVAEGRCGRACGAVTGSLAVVHTPFYYVLAAALGLYAVLLGTRTDAPRPDDSQAAGGNDGRPA